MSVVHVLAEAAPLFVMCLVLLLAWRIRRLLRQVVLLKQTIEVLERLRARDRERVIAAEARASRVGGQAAVKPTIERVRG